VDLGLAKGGKMKERRSPPRDRDRERERERDGGFKRERPSNFYPEDRVLKKFIPESNNYQTNNKPSLNLGPIGVIPLLVIHTALRNYANHILANFSAAGIQIEVRFVNRTVFQQSIDDSIAKSERYTMVIQS
jgi:hypothetical protein